jgi:hypothetical protein
MAQMVAYWSLNPTTQKAFLKLLLFLHKLGSEYDFHTSVYSFLQDRSMMIEVDGVKSSPRYLFSGVPQGCILYPLFFLYVYKRPMLAHSFS